MDIQEFINLGAGKWFSQRTSYQLAAQKVANNKAEITIELLTATADDVVQLCLENNCDSQQNLGAWKASWDNSVDWGQPKKNGSTYIIWLPSEDFYRGKLMKSDGKSAVVGDYHLRSDEALTLTLEDNQQRIEERIWFASPNLRLRTSVILYPNGERQTIFYSEIRKMTA
jgi:phycoerythrin-associated linker protein